MIEFYKDELGREWDDTEFEYDNNCGYNWYITSLDEVAADGITLTIKMWVYSDDIFSQNPDEDIDELIIDNMTLDSVYCDKNGDEVPTPDGVTLPTDEEALKIVKGVLSCSNYFSGHILDKAEEYYANRDEDEYDW